MIRRISCILLGLLLLSSAVSAQDSTPTPQHYTVASGDTLSSIAGRYHTTILALIRANNIVDANRVFVGSILVIPGDTQGAPQTSTQTAPAATPSELPPSPTLIPTIVLPLIDFEIGGEVFNTDNLRALRQAKMTWVKVILPWNTGDAADAAGSLIRRIQNNHYKILLEISGDAQAFHSDPAGYTEQFAAYLGQVAALAPDAIEVWSGMNADSISAGDYGQLLSASFFAIKRANLQVLVISGSLQKTNSLGGQCTSFGCGDIPYLNALLEAGVGSAADCIGMSYTLGTVSPDEIYGDSRGEEFDYYYPTLVSTYATIFPNKQLCFTEFGYLVTGQVPLANRYEWAQNTTIELRAQWLARAALVASQSGRIRLMIVYNMDATVNTGDSPATNYAIVNATGDCSACRTLSKALPTPAS